MSETSIIKSKEYNTEINIEDIVETYNNNNYLFNKEQIVVIICNHNISNYNGKHFEKDDSRYDIKEDVSKNNNSIKLYHQKNIENSNDKNIK